MNFIIFKKFSEKDIKNYDFFQNKKIHSKSKFSEKKQKLFIGSSNLKHSVK